VFGDNIVAATITPTRSNKFNTPLGLQLIFLVLVKIVSISFCPPAIRLLVRNMEAVVIFALRNLRVIDFQYSSK
jgi:hypothetical protein